jgi:hypothetical protein
MKANLFLLALAVILIGVYGYTADSRVNYNELTKEWRFAGYANNNSDSITHTPTEDCADCYIIKLKEDYTFIGQTIDNSVSGSFSINDNNYLSFDVNWSTDITETKEHYNYLKELPETHSFSLSDSELRLYYNKNGDYLLFRAG